MTRSLNVGIVGYKFMGRAHSNAFRKAPRFFGGDVRCNLKVACGRHGPSLERFAAEWGWEETETSWEKLVDRDDIDLIDIASPTDTHRDIVVAAARAGKHVLCEKPMALNAAEAREMYEAVRAAGVKHLIGHNYRRVPAVRYARKLIDDGRIGDIYHWRGAYLQDWIVDPRFPLTWHLRREVAGYGPHADLNSHSVDLARYLVGEIRTVSCTMATFIKERPLPAAENEPAFEAAAAEGTGRVTVDDASFMVVEFASGALGSFEASRFASGRKNQNSFEIYGSKGSLRLDLERLNELEFYSREDAAELRGFKTILVTEPGHPYIGSWWPPGHTIGYEHTFVHEVVDFVRSIHKGEGIEPDLYDGLRCMEVLDAGARSAKEGRRIDVPVTER